MFTAKAGPPSRTTPPTITITAAHTIDIATSKLQAFLNHPALGERSDKREVLGLVGAGTVGAGPSPSRDAYVTRVLSASLSKSVESHDVVARYHSPSAPLLSDPFASVDGCTACHARSCESSLRRRVVSEVLEDR